MTVRIGDHILSGELRNSRRNGVFGWIEFAPDYGIRIELTGNFSGPLEGKHLRFHSAKADSHTLPQPEELPDEINELADRQIGVVGDIVLRKTMVPDIPIDEFLDLADDQKTAHLVEKDSLYLEWFSQNGRVVAEVLEPTLEFVDNDGEATDESIDFEALEGGGYGVGFTEIHIDEDGVAHAEHYGLDDEDLELEGEVDDDDPYGLFSGDLDRRVAESLGQSPPASDQSEDHRPPGKRSWEEVIPGIDPETKAMYEQWDEIFEGKKDEPISYLFEKPLKLPKPENVQNEKEAAVFVKKILAQLALLSVALDVCEHYSAIDTYRLLMNEILPTAKVHPNLAASEMVQHYSTSDFCPKCEAEFDAEYEATQDHEPDDDDSSAGDEEIAES